MAELLRPPAPPSRWARWAENTAIIGFWALLAAVALVRRALLPDPPFSLHTIGVTLVEYAPWALLTPGVFALAHWLPIDRRHGLSRLALHLAVAVAFALGVAAFQHVAMRALGAPAGVTMGGPRSGGLMPGDPLPGGPGTGGPPPGPPPEGFSPSRPPDGGASGAGRPPGGPPPRGPGFERQVPGDRRSGPPLFRLSYQFITYLVILAVGMARAYALQLRERQAEAALLAAERERLAAQLTEAQLAALRMQLNPHFLFNALNAVSALVEDDPEGVRRIVARLSAMLRRVLDGRADQEVALRDELAFLQDYLDIQRVRFEDDLEVEEDVEVAALDACVPFLILQPLVENAVEHGAGQAVGVGRVTIRARREHLPDGTEGLVATITDNGPGLAGSDATRPGAVGVANTRARLAAHFGPRATLTIRDAEGGGVEARVVVPYRPAADRHA